MLLQTANGPRPGHLITVQAIEVQGVKAARVPAVVIDDLGGGIDGLLGLSFLSRFDLKQTRGTFEIAALEDLYLPYKQKRKTKAAMAREAGLDDVIVFGGGIIPDEDVPKLKEQGVSAVFTPGARMQEIIDFIRRHARRAANVNAN